MCEAYAVFPDTGILRCDKEQDHIGVHVNDATGIWWVS